MDNFDKIIIRTIVGSLIFSMFLVVFIYFSGSMFGHQCEKFYTWGSPEHTLCVRNLYKDLPHDQGINK